MWQLIKSAASLSVPSWVTAAIISAAFVGYTGWVMLKQHERDQVKFDALAEQNRRFVEGVRQLGEAALATRARIEAENAARLKTMEDDHAKQEQRLKDESARADERARRGLADLRLQLDHARGGPGGGPIAGAPGAAEGVDRVECYDAAKLDERVRGSLGRFLARASGVVRRGEEAESLVDLCRAFAAGFRPIAPPLK